MLSRGARRILEIVQIVGVLFLLLLVLPCPALAQDNEIVAVNDCGNEGLCDRKTGTSDNDSRGEVNGFDSGFNDWRNGRSEMGPARHPPAAAAASFSSHQRRRRRRPIPVVCQLNFWPLFSSRIDSTTPVFLAASPLTTDRHNKMGGGGGDNDRVLINIL